MKRKDLKAKKRWETVLILKLWCRFDHFPLTYLCVDVTKFGQQNNIVG